MVTKWRKEDGDFSLLKSFITNKGENSDSLFSIAVTALTEN